MDPEPRQGGRNTVKKILRYFVQGLIIITPIALTVWAILATFTFVDNLFPNLIHKIFPSLIHTDADGNLKKIPGLGFRRDHLDRDPRWAGSAPTFLMGSFISFFDQWMERTPIIKFIYTSTKEFFEAFAGEKRKFNKAVLASVFADDVWIVGFVTDEELLKFNLGADKVSVYVPQSYHWAGQLYILPRHKVKTIDKINAGEAMKYAVTGGVVDVEEEKTIVHTIPDDKTNTINSTTQPGTVPEKSF